MYSVWTMSKLVKWAEEICMQSHINIRMITMRYSNGERQEEEEGQGLIVKMVQSN